VDFSSVLFLCTANSTETIPAPLLDRMEVIHLSGYTTEEKVRIASRYLWPNLRSSMGLAASQVAIKAPALRDLSIGWCREAGVRALKQHLEKCLRVAALKVAEDDSYTTTINVGNLPEFAGRRKFTRDRLYADPLPPGVVMGLAWSSLGGTSLFLETLVLGESPSPHGHGSGSGGAMLKVTGHLGEVMTESATIAHSYARSFLRQLSFSSTTTTTTTSSAMHATAPVNYDFLEKASIHLHVPEGATPKDGPSAGIAMVCSFLSLALNRPLLSSTAMTGEVTLSGHVLPIGGVQEKVLAAKRANVKHVILPEDNRSDWEELPEYVKKGIHVNFVSHFSEVYDLVLAPDAEKNRKSQKMKDKK